MKKKKLSEINQMVYSIIDVMNIVKEVESWIAWNRRKCLVKWSDKKEGKKEKRK